MSEHLSRDGTRTAGDREYLWFSLLLLAVLTTSVYHPGGLQKTATNLETAAPSP